MRRVALVLSLPLIALAATAGPSTAAITLLGAADKPRPLPLRLEAPPKDAEPRGLRLRGALHLPVRNGGKDPVQLRVRYSATGLDRLITLPGASTLVTLTPRRGLGEARLDTLAKSLSASDTRATVRVLRRVGRAPTAESSSFAAREVAADIRTAIAADGDVTDAAASRVARKLAKLLVGSEQAAPELAGGDVKPILAALDEGSGELTTALRAFERAASQRRYPVVAAGELGSVNLSFELPAGRVPSDLSGTVVVESFTGSTPRSQSEVTATIDATARPVSGATFEPDKVIVQVTRGCPFGACDARKGDDDLRLVGPGNREALEDLSRAGVTGAAAILRSDSGDQVTATLQPLAADEADPAIAGAPLELDKDPSPGTYTGKLPLSRFASASPALPVEVRSRLWFPYAVLLILAGVIVAGVLTHQLGLSRRKNLIRRYLRENVAKYAAGRESNVVGSETLLEELEIQLPLSDDPKWQYFDKLDSPQAAYTAVRWARSDADLDEAQAAAAREALRITAWLHAVKQVRVLYDLSAREPSKAEAGALIWRSSKTASYSRQLLAKVKRSPPEGGADDPLLAQIERQARWHRAFARAYELRIQASEVSGERAAAIDLKVIDDALAPVSTRTDDDQDVLEDQLNETIRQLEEILTPGDELAPLGPAPETSEIRGLRTQVAIQQRATPSQQLALMQCAPAPDAPPEGAVAPDPTRLAALRENVDPRDFRRRLKLRDTGLSLVILAMTSLVYALTVYDSTWGSWDDLITAFVAGFAGHVAIKWGLLPVYRSIRMGTPAAVETAEPLIAAGTALGAPTK